MSSLHRLTTALAALSTLGFVLGSAQAATPSVVKVQLDNTGKVETLKLDRTSVPAGKVRFEVTNASMDDTHEMIVVKTAADAGQVPDQQGRQQGRRKVVQGRQGSQ